MAKTLDVNMPATFSGAATFTGPATFNSTVDMNSTLTVAGVATFTGAANFDAAVDMDGTLAVAGVATFTGAVNFDGLVDIDSDVNIAGTLTVTGDITGIASGLRETGAGADILKFKVIEIGDWNMDTTEEKTVAHGVGAITGIIGVAGVIRGDSDIGRFVFGSALAYTDVELTVHQINATNIVLRRQTGGSFDGTGYDSTSYNRGWVTLFLLS